MKNKTFKLLLAGMALTAISWNGMASASSSWTPAVTGPIDGTFTSRINFDGETEDGISYYTIGSTGSEDFTFDFTHSLGVLTVGNENTYWELSLAYRISRGGNSVWLAYGGDSYFLGELNQSDTDKAWVTDTWDVTSAVLTATSMNSSSLSLIVKLTETSPGTDYLDLDSSQLTGTSAAVPLPGTALLLGPAVLGLVGTRLSRKKK